VAAQRQSGGQDCQKPRVIERIHPEMILGMASRQR
jgi:hypothetical protein